MKFASSRLIAADIKALVSFYEKVTSQTADWLAPVLAENCHSSGNARDWERGDGGAIQGGKR